MICLPHTMITQKFCLAVFLRVFCSGYLFILSKYNKWHMLNWFNVAYSFLHNKNYSHPTFLPSVQERFTFLRSTSCLLNSYQDWSFWIAEQSQTYVRHWFLPLLLVCLKYSDIMKFQQNIYIQFSHGIQYILHLSHDLSICGSRLVPNCTGPVFYCPYLQRSWNKTKNTCWGNSDHSYVRRWNALHPLPCAVQLQIY